MQITGGLQMLHTREQYARYLHHAVSTEEQGKQGVEVQARRRPRKSDMRCDVGGNARPITGLFCRA
jgi:hypothetical protein